MCRSPKSRQAAWWLCALQRSAIQPTEWAWLRTHGSPWWNSRNSRAPQRRPPGDTYVQRTHAPGEHRGERLAQIQAPRVDFAEMRKQLGLNRVSASNQCVQA